MPRYDNSNFLDNGLNYLKNNCNKVILTDIYTATYATANGTAKVAEATLTSAAFSLSGADGASRVLTGALSGVAAGNAQKAVVDGTNMHLVFVNATTGEVIHVTPESGHQSLTQGVPVTINNNLTYTANQAAA